jgi:ribose 5-phosphate isomerase B
MRIAIGSDHRGIQIKHKLVQHLTSDGHEVEDCGTHGDQAVDYPDFAAEVSKRVSEGKVERGILICGTGIGMAIAANKFPHVRAATCSDEIMAETCRRHNDVNVLCLPGDLIGDRPVGDLIRVWLATEFDGGRHARRIEKIAELERKNASGCK